MQHLKSVFAFNEQDNGLAGGIGIGVGDMARIDAALLERSKQQLGRVRSAARDDDESTLEGLRLAVALHDHACHGRAGSRTSWRVADRIPKLRPLLQ